MSEYDVITVLGNGFGPEWGVPPFVAQRLELVSALYKKGVAPKIALSGKWSINWDKQNITPPTTEAQVMKEKLLQLGVPEEDIYFEAHSKDTIGNAVGLKMLFKKKPEIKNILVVCADFSRERASYVFNEVFDKSGHTVTIIPTPTTFTGNVEMEEFQRELLEKQKPLIKEIVQNIELYDASLQNLYDMPYYKNHTLDKVAHAAMGGMHTGGKIK